MTTNDTPEPTTPKEPEAPTEALVPATRYFKADNCLRRLADQTFVPYSNIGSWWGACKTTDPQVGAALTELCSDPRNAVWEIDATEYATLTKTTIEIGKHKEVPEKLAAKIAANTAAMATIEVIKQDLDVKSTEVIVESVDESVKVAAVERPKQRPKAPKPWKGKDLGSIPIGADIPRPNFDAP